MGMALSPPHLDKIQKNSSFFLRENVPKAFHSYLESYDTQLSFGLSKKHFSASCEASEFCWQIGLNFLQHLRPYLIQSIFLQLIFLMQSHGFLQLIFQFHVFSQIILDAVSRAWECPCREESFLPPVTTPQSTC